MTTAVSTRRLTIEEFLSQDHSGLELVDGLLQENLVSSETSWLAGEIHGQIRDFLKGRQLGFVFPQDTPFAAWSEAAKVRKPDVMFFRAGRLERIGHGIVRIAPDLAIEIVSPGDEAEALERKLHDYRAAGIPLVWVIYPGTHSAHIYRDGQPEVIDEATPLSGEHVLPGFSLDLAALLRMAAEVR